MLPTHRQRARPPPESRESARRNPGDFGDVVIVRFGSFALDLHRRQLRAEDGVRHLTPKAFDLLALLVREAPRVLPKQELHERLWPDAHVSDASLVGLVKEIRRVLDDYDADAPIIRTAHRVGYAFTREAGVSTGADASASATASGRYSLVFSEQKMMLARGDNVLGRDPAAQLHVDHAGVSRRHARLTVDDHGVRIEDLDSKNGTLVEGQPIAGSVALKDGDRCAFGPVVAVFRATGAEASTITQSRLRSGPVRLARRR
jgi:DNA-binding winged helix-turn-helix (wHTH) protein